MKTVKRIGAILIALTLVVASLTSCRQLLMNLFYGDRVLTPYEEMVYESPDFEALEEEIKSLSELLKSESVSKKEAADLLYDICDSYYYGVYTMQSLSFLRYSNDITNEKNRDEYYHIMAEAKRIGLLMDELFYLCADSPHRNYLEARVMGEDFFDSYEGGPFTYPKELIALMEKETVLLNRYSKTMADRSVTFEGTTYTEADIAAITDEALYRKVYEAYIKEYNTKLGRIYVELVEVRREIARYFGFSSYADYAYANIYQREYSVQQSNTFLKGIRRYIVPVFEQVVDDIMENGGFAMKNATPEETLWRANQLVDTMPDSLSELFAEMRNKNLCTVAVSDTMYYGSFQIYFPRYEAPYLFVNGEGIYSDVLTVMHEFGHFASAYVNYGVTGSNDESEVASQGLELLSLTYLDGVMDPEDAEMLRQYKLTSALFSLVEQAAYSAFENDVYKDAALTVQECNAYFLESLEDYGLTSLFGATGAMEWVFLHHLFEYPYYVIGYAVSADVALQIYMQGAEQGMETYLELIRLAGRNDFFENLTEVGLKRPLLWERSEEMADIFAEALT